jgi:hypothetical protein
MSQESAQARRRASSHAATSIGVSASATFSAGYTVPGLQWPNGAAKIVGPGARARNAVRRGKPQNAAADIFGNLKALNAYGAGRAQNDDVFFQFRPPRKLISDRDVLKTG